MSLNSKEKKMLGMSTAKGHALKHKTEKHEMHKTSSSRDFCRHCGEETSRMVRHESGHREYDHERSGVGSMKLDN